MLAINCCKTMEAELTAWKANVYDIARKMEALPGAEREKIFSNIEDLHILIAEMDARIDQIRENCSPETCIDDIRTVSMREKRVISPRVALPKKLSKILRSRSL